MVEESPRVVVPSSSAPEPERVRQLFDRLASRYDWFNLWASLGLDRSWRNGLLRKARSVAKSGVILDIGSGTGDLLFGYLSQEEAGETGSLIGMDLSWPMLSVAVKKRNRLSPEVQGRIWTIQADAQAIPLADAGVDVVISAFVLRNIRGVQDQVFSEVLRVLKPGGKVFLLDLSVPKSSVLRMFHSIYLKWVLPWVGRLVFRESSPQEYLAQTIRSFGPPEEFCRWLDRKGFSQVGFSRFSGGIAVMYEAQKN